MKVVFISLFKRGMGGGEGRVAHELAHQFALHYETVMICPGDETGLYETEDGLKVFGVRSAGDEEFRMPALSGKTVRKMFDFLDDFSPDVVHAHEPTLLGLIGQIWARLHLVPFVHTSHVLPSKVLDFGASEALDAVLRGLLSGSLTHRALADFYENCDAIIALNQSALESLRDFGYRGKIFVIPNGRDLQQYGQCRCADVGAEQKNLVFVGYVTERKNQIYLLNVMRHLPDYYRLHLVGKPLVPEYGKQLKSFCDEHGLSKVDFVGHVEHEEIPSYLETSHVFTSASKMEVQSLVVIEALASGTPVVGLSNETIDELVDEQVGERLPKETDPADFARQVERLCNLSQSEYETLCANARDRVSHLDWSSVVEETTRAYRELLDEKSKPSITEQQGAKMNDLVDLLSSGEVREILRNRINISKGERKETTKWLLGVALPDKLKPLTRVPGSTWLLAGLTVVGSLIGYLLYKGKSDSNESTW